MKKSYREKVGFLPRNISLAIQCNSHAHSSLGKHRLVPYPRKYLQPYYSTQDPRKHIALHHLTLQLKH